MAGTRYVEMEAVRFTDMQKQCVIQQAATSSADNTTTESTSTFQEVFAGRYDGLIFVRHTLQVTNNNHH